MQKLFILILIVGIQVSLQSSAEELIGGDVSGGGDPYERLAVQKINEVIEARLKNTPYYDIAKNTLKSSNVYVRKKYFLSEEGKKINFEKRNWLNYYNNIIYGGPDGTVYGLSFPGTIQLAFDMFFDKSEMKILSNDILELIGISDADILHEVFQASGSVDDSNYQVTVIELQLNKKRLPQEVKYVQCEVEVQAYFSPYRSHPSPSVWGYYVNVYGKDKYGFAKKLFGSLSSVDFNDDASSVAVAVSTRLISNSDQAEALGRSKVGEYSVQEKKICPDEEPVITYGFDQKEIDKIENKKNQSSIKTKRRGPFRR